MRGSRKPDASPEGSPSGTEPVGLHGCYFHPGKETHAPSAFSSGFFAYLCYVPLGTLAFVLSLGLSQLCCE